MKAEASRPATGPMDDLATAEQSPSLPPATPSRDAPLGATRPSAARVSAAYAQSTPAPATHAQPAPAAADPTNAAQQLAAQANAAANSAPTPHEPRAGRAEAGAATKSPVASRSAAGPEVAGSLAIAPGTGRGPAAGLPLPTTALDGVTAGPKDANPRADLPARAAEHAVAAAKKAAAAPTRPPDESTATAPSKDDLTAPTQTLAASLPRESSPASIASATPAPAPAALPFARDASNDASLHVSVLPQAAHVRVDLDGAGDLSLHLRMREGVAHVTLAGTAAPLVDARSSDLRTALAGQGISLGRVEVVGSTASENQSSDLTNQSGSHDGSRGQQQQEAADRDTPHEKPSSSAPSRTDGVGYTISRSTPWHAARKS